MKKTITSSVEKDADTGYIGALAAELLTHATAVNATLGLYFRLAFIRAHTKANHAANEFWTKVDDQLEELHSETPQEFVAALELIYDDDIELYVARPQWLRNLATTATQVQRFKKQGTKRKRRAQVNDEEGEEPETREQEEPEENGNGAGGNNSDADPE
ncbi:hypothetical protein K438DRAFT_2025030 [Mycena galopus ATCC 62051]|nr:hypothetical protein K438DRAFT_2025030 [Mycena galopus ATCC 62051]